MMKNKSIYFLLGIYDYYYNYILTYKWVLWCVIHDENTVYVIYMGNYVPEKLTIDTFCKLLINKDIFITLSFKKYKTAVIFMFPFSIYIDTFVYINRHLFISSCC